MLLQLARQEFGTIPMIVPFCLGPYKLSQVRRIEERPPKVGEKLGFINIYLLQTLSHS
jgi:hypothetical protein